MKVKEEPPFQYHMLWLVHFNTLRPRQNGRHFADDTFNRIFVNENARIAIEFSLKFVPKGPMNNILALVQTMAWRRPGDKSLSEPMVTQFNDAIQTWILLFKDHPWICLVSPPSVHIYTLIIFCLDTWIISTQMKFYSLFVSPHFEQITKNNNFGLANLSY